MTLTAEQIKALKFQAKSLKPFLQIGKNGLGQHTTTQITNYLKANKLGKIKMLRSFLDEQDKSKKELAKLLAENTGAELIDLVGFVIVLYKR